MKIQTLYKISVVVVLSTGCNKFVDVPPTPTQITSDRVFEDDATATKAIIGVYIDMMGSSQFSSGATTFYGGLCADELYYYTPDLKQEFVTNKISQSSHDLLSVLFWRPAYKYIYAANACIEGLQRSKSITPLAKKTLTGEAKFVRAYCYFYLVNLFGDVPLITSTGYEENAVMERTSKDKVYAQIVADLTDAQNLLSDNYPTAERVRPNKWTATALLARTYLYMGSWANAEVQASSIISSGLYRLNSNLNNVFLKNSNETIFQLQPSVNNINTWEGNMIVPPSGAAIPTYLLTDVLLGSFEAGDLRKVNWVQSRRYSNQTLYYPFKYKIFSNSVATEYYILFRLAEQYLIRAEAEAQQGKIVQAQGDLNAIRNRAGLAVTSATDKASLLGAIEQERRVELFSEWAHRWLDLKRTKRADPVLGALKPGTWQATAIWWPIPSGQIFLNPSLKQNPGY